MVLLLFRLQVYPLHSTVTLEEQNGVFLLPVPGYRKVKTVSSSVSRFLTACCTDNLLTRTGHPLNKHR